MPITMNQYQSLAQRTAQSDHPLMMRKAIAALGLAGEAGEAADLIKKEVGHGHPPDRERIARELGDVLWYVAEVAACYGLTLGEVAHGNVIKLVERYPDGFTTAASLARVDTKKGAVT